MATEMPAKKPKTFAMKSMTTGTVGKMADFPPTRQQLRQTAET
jgi:hypothetical protein